MAANKALFVEKVRDALEGFEESADQGLTTQQYWTQLKTLFGSRSAPIPHDSIWGAASAGNVDAVASPSDASSGDDFEGDRDDDDAAAKAAKDAKNAKGGKKASRRRKRKKAPRMMDSASFGKGSGDEDSDDDAPGGLDAESSVGRGSGGKKRKVKKDPNKPKGATSAFVYYSKEARPLIKAASPDMAFGDIAKKVGADWKALGEDAKKPYEALNEADKARHATEMDGYEAPPVEYEAEKKKTKKKKKKDPNMPKKGLSA